MDGLNDFGAGMEDALTLGGRIPIGVGMALTVAAIVGVFLFLEWRNKRREP